MLQQALQIVDELHPEEPQVELPSLDETEPTWPRNAYTLWLREQQNQDSSGMRTLWLASSSPRRRLLMENSGFQPRCVSSDLDDDLLSS